MYKIFLFVLVLLVVVVAAVGTFVKADQYVIVAVLSSVLVVIGLSGSVLLALLTLNLAYNVSLATMWVVTDGASLFVVMYVLTTAGFITMLFLGLILEYRIVFGTKKMLYITSGLFGSAGIVLMCLGVFFGTSLFTFTNGVALLFLAVEMNRSVRISKRDT